MDAAQILRVFLLKLAGKKTVVTAYGSDVQTQTRIQNLLLKHAYCMDYPQSVRNEREVFRDIEYTSHQADYIISGVDWVEHIPWWNKLVAGHFAIDTETWSPDPDWAPSPGPRRGQSASSTPRTIKN